MNEITRQLNEICIQEQELLEKAAQLRRQRLLLQKQQYEEEIKRIDDELEVNDTDASDISKLSMLLTEQHQRIENLEKNNSRKVRTTIPKQPPNQRPKPVRRTRVVKQEPVPPKPCEVIIDFSNTKSEDMHNIIYSELVSDNKWVEDDEQSRINQLLYGELSPADTEKINNDDKLFQDYISGAYTPNSYTQNTITGHQAAIDEHIRRRMKGTRWRTTIPEPPVPHKRLWERVSDTSNTEYETKNTEFSTPLDDLVNGGDHVFRHTKIE